MYQWGYVQINEYLHIYKKPCTLILLRQRTRKVGNVRGCERERPASQSVVRGLTAQSKGASPVWPTTPHCTGHMRKWPSISFKSKQWASSPPPHLLTVSAGSVVSPEPHQQWGTCRDWRVTEGKIFVPKKRMFIEESFTLSVYFVCTLRNQSITLHSAQFPINKLLPCRRCCVCL